MVEDRGFRLDLFYRLSQHHINIPPLRERKEDIPLLIEYFAEQAANELEKEKPAIQSEIYDLLSAYSFPGNIRELQALIFDAITRHESGELDVRFFWKKFKSTCQKIGKRTEKKTGIFVSYILHWIACPLSLSLKIVSCKKL